MAQGITLRLADPDTQLPAPLLRQIGWFMKSNAEALYPALGDLIVEVFDTTDFDFGRGIAEGKDKNG